MASSAEARPTSGCEPAPRPLGHLRAHLDDSARRFDTGERLCIGIGDDEVDAFEPRLDHVVDGIAAGAADAEHDDARLHLVNVGDASHCSPTIARDAAEGKDRDSYPRAALRSEFTRVAASCPSRRSVLSIELSVEGTGRRTVDLPLQPRRRFLAVVAAAGRLQQLGHQAIGALAFVLETRRGDQRGARASSCTIAASNAATLAVHWAASPAWRRPAAVLACVVFQRDQRSPGLCHPPKAKARQAGAAWQANARPLARCSGGRRGHHRSETQRTSAVLLERTGR